MKTRLCQLFAWLAALYAAVLCVLYFQQENLLLYPSKLPAHYAYAFRLPHEEIALPVNGAVLNGLHFRPPHAHSKGAILFFHGTHDTLIPAIHGQRLAQTLGTRAQYHELPAGHNDMFSQAALWHTLEQALP